MKRKYVRDKEAKIHLIFETFADLVNRNGYDKLSTRHIAEAAGISIGTIYHYFPGGKHAITSGYIDRVTDELFDPRIFEKLGNGDLKGFLEDLIRGYLYVHKENSEIHRAIDQAILAESDVYRRNIEAITTNLGRVVAELKGVGLYGEIPNSTVLKGFVLFFNVLEALVHRHLFFYPLYKSEEDLVVFLVSLLEHLAKENEIFSV